jgi:adenylate kinase family enzyme
MQRVIVGGSSGAGKTTLARRLATELGLPYVELDSLFHGPGWTRRPTFVEDVTEFAAGDRWVTDSLGYADVVDLLWDRADTLVWLDFPRWLCELRVLRRSLVRGALRSPLWNGNHESLIRMVRDPEHPIRWTWQHYAAKRQLVLDRMDDPRWAHVSVVPLRSPGELARWLRQRRPDIS